MALLHQAEITPGKLELLAAWLPSRGWYEGPADAEVERVSACRLDDPAGEVGVEIMLVRAGDGPIHHVPLTYRGAPLDGGDDWLVGTCDHSVLGTRWVYDACGDPVYVAALASAIFTGSGQAQEFVDVDGQPVPREPIMTVSGSGHEGEVLTAHAIARVVDGDPTVIVTESAELTVVRVVDPGSRADGAVLRGSWAGQAAPVVLASAYPSVS